MLLEITIKNFAIIEEISLNFENGMTVLTGETGAGKSIIIDAMNLMLSVIQHLRLKFRASFQSNKILPWLVSWKIMGFLLRMN